MAATELIAVGNTAATADFTLADGETAILAIKPSSTSTTGAPGNADVDVRVLLASGGYVHAGKLTAAQAAVRVEGTTGGASFRVSRPATSGDSYGVDKI